MGRLTKQTENGYEFLSETDGVMVDMKTIAKRLGTYEDAEEQGRLLPEWIKCNERLPEPGERVLAVCGTLVCEMHVNNNGIWTRHDNHSIISADEPVTYWKPMPQLPINLNVGGHKQPVYMENEIDDDGLLNIKGYKVFNPDWTFRGFQFEVGQTYEQDVTPQCCKEGFHFCLKVIDCFKHYGFNPDNKVAEVIALGYVDYCDEDSKCVANKIKIIRELNWHEVLDMANIGKNCTGINNSGNSNSGDFNSGAFNSGHYNSGHYNNGDGNSGNHNSGYYNSGNGNSGHYNSGNRNSGDGNNGDGNSGDHNNGHYNSGNRNSGNYNSGNFNSGNRNSGNHNSGHYNSGDYNSGYFNTDEPKVRLFNKESNWVFNEWRNSKAYMILQGISIEYKMLAWVDSAEMTDAEKEEHPEYIITGGYLKEIENSIGKQEWWDSLSDEEKAEVKSIPNFDADIFEETTGIDTNKC